MSNKGQRVDWIDIAKGIGILLVILGHTRELPLLLKEYIYSFHMPLFFILSGYVYNEVKNKDVKLSNFAKKKFNRLIIP